MAPPEAGNADQKTLDGIKAPIAALEAEMAALHSDK
jgi:hypothetical protein